MPGLQAGASREGVMKVKDFAKKRGYCKPVVLSDSDGCMTILSGSATFEACLEEKEANIPAVIVQTDGEADDLMFALQSAELDDTLGAVAAGSAIVRLIDHHGIPRKHIVETLGRSRAWLSRMESLSRSLNAEVQRLVAEGMVTARSAQEIARLPADVQTAFAISTSNDLLGKDSIMYLVNRYLNEDTGSEERARIIGTPKMALPDEQRQRIRMSRDNSVSARLARAVAGCLDRNAHLANVLSGADVSEAAIRMTDIEALIDSLTVLREKLLGIFALGENGGGGAHA
jgi:ParB-like chromosome segregation protein Spo0J